MTYQANHQQLLSGNKINNLNVKKSDILTLYIIDLPDLGGSKLIVDQGYSIETLVFY
jgi:hypothetical protein